VDIHEAMEVLEGRRDAGLTAGGIHGQHPTEQKDRNYLRSIYFREPGLLGFSDDRF
jgi:hypothetical protein